MLASELLNILYKFYTECSLRGWCCVDKREGKDFLTLFSSETNFTHLQLNFGKFPDKVLISPTLSSKNIKKIERINSSFDSTRLISIEPRWNRFRVTITNQYGKTLLVENIRIYTVRRFKAFSLRVINPQ